MAGKATNYSAGLLALIFQAVTTGGSSLLNTSGFTLAQNGGGTPATSLYVSLHTADPGASGGNSQSTSEAAYTGYARQAVVRSASGWTLSGQTINNAAAITFPQASSGPEVETYFGIGLESSGATPLLYSGALTSSLTVNNGITPSFAVDELTITET
jgi:hypothetical protein